MATQIAPTPVVKGTAAVKIYKEANQKRSQASENGAIWNFPTPLFRWNLYQPVVLDYDSPVSMRLWIDEYLAEKSDEITES